MKTGNTNSFASRSKYQTVDMQNLHVVPVHLQSSTWVDKSLMNCQF